MSAKRHLGHHIIDDSDEEIFVSSKRPRRVAYPHPSSRTVSPEDGQVKAVQAIARELPRFESNTAKVATETIANAPAAPTVKTYQDVLGNEFVTLYISPSGAPFTIHRNPLAAHCPAFVASLNIPVSGAQFYEHHAPFLDFTVVAFAAIVEFLYRKVVPTLNRARTIRGEITRYMEIYEIAQKMSFRSLKNVLVTQIGIIYLSKEIRPSIADVRFVYTRTQKDCGLRKLVASHVAFANLTAGKKSKKGAGDGRRDRAVKEIQPDVITELMTEFPDLGADIVNVSSGWFKDGRKGVLRLGKGLVCEVHEHSEGRYKNCRDAGKNWSDMVGDDDEAEE